MYSEGSRSVCHKISQCAKVGNINLLLDWDNKDRDKGKLSEQILSQYTGDLSISTFW